MESGILQGKKVEQILQEGHFGVIFGYQYLKIEEDLGIYITGIADPYIEPATVWIWWSNSTWLVH